MKYPRWYGIKDIGFVWCGSWSDPLIHYKGGYYNSSDIEDCMWSWCKEWCEENNIAINDDVFAEYMRSNTDDLYELIENCTPIEKNRAKRVIEAGAWSQMLFGR